MERRNFLTGMLLAPFGWGVAKSCNCNEIEELEDFIPPISTEITFYGLFKEEDMIFFNEGKVVVNNRCRYNGDTVRLGWAVYVDERGYCTFDSQYRLIGYVKQIDNNGILVAMRHITGKRLMKTFPSQYELSHA